MADTKIISIPNALLLEARKNNSTLSNREKSWLRMVSKGYSIDFRMDAPIDPRRNLDRPWEEPPFLSADEIAELVSPLDQEELDAMGPLPGYSWIAMQGTK